MSLEIPDGGFTVVVGPNGCGKSTLLRALGRTLAPLSDPEIAGRRVALFADDAAIPVLYSIVLQWPEGVPGVGSVAAGDAEAFAELPAFPGLESGGTLADIDDLAIGI